MLEELACLWDGVLGTVSLAEGHGVGLGLEAERFTALVWSESVWRKKKKTDGETERDRSRLGLVRWGAVGVCVCVCVLIV